MAKLCSPALIYFIFSVTQILIDLFKGMYNTAAMKVIVTIMVTLLLNILCERGLGLVSWIIVFVPFILMTVIVTILLYVFGLDPATGTLNVTQTVTQQQEQQPQKPQQGLMGGWSSDPAYQS
jgi:hypothetical protein